MYQLIHPSSFFTGLFAFRLFEILSGVMATLICSAGHNRPSRVCSAPSSTPNDLKYKAMPAGNVTITCKWETATTTAKGITSFSINGVAGAVNNNTNTITITMPRGTDVTKLTPVIATNGVKSLTPGNGETVDFTNAVTYTAAMEDGSSKTYTVTVYVDKGTLADQFWDKLTDFATQVPWWQYAEKQQSTSKYPKYW